MVIRSSDQLRHWARGLNHGLLKPQPLLLHRRFDGVLVSMPHSGWPWLRYMLGLILAKLYDLPPPSDIHDDKIIGNIIYPQIPQVLCTHTIPHYFFRSRTLFRLFHFPRHLVVVRDLRDSLVFHYEKRNHVYNVDFSTYLRGDARGKTYRNDIWTRIHFMNGWGTVVERHPEQAAALRYEDFLADPRGRLAQICAHFNIEGVPPNVLDEVVAVSSKSEMAKRTERRSLTLSIEPRPAEEWFSDEDRRFLAEVCRRHLKYTFGYQYW